MIYTHLWYSSIHCGGIIFHSLLTQFIIQVSAPYKNNVRVCQHRHLNLTRNVSLMGSRFLTVSIHDFCYVRAFLRSSPALRKYQWTPNQLKIRLIDIACCLRQVLSGSSQMGTVLNWMRQTIIRHFFPIPCDPIRHSRNICIHKKARARMRHSNCFVTFRNFITKRKP